MRRSSISAAIRNVVLLALAEACGQPTDDCSCPADASKDESVASDAPIEASADVDAGDAGDLDALTPIDVPLLPLPDGCVVTGKPDGFAPCGYTENLNDFAACQIDYDANTQEAAVCFVLCDPTEPDCIYYDLGDSGGSILTCGPGCIGRLRRDAREEYETCASSRSDAEDFLARAAMLEAASIDAFRVLASELDHHGAKNLARDARRAAKDEVRHARAMSRLAKRGGSRNRQRCRPTGNIADRSPKTRSILAIAIENVEEGCVRETFGAALASWQAETARDPAVREAMRAIARDEIRHAELGWKIAAWADERLSPRDRARVEIARKNALSVMRRDLTASLDESSRQKLGLPNHDQALALFDALTDSLPFESSPRA